MKTKSGVLYLSVLADSTVGDSLNSDVRCCCCGVFNSDCKFISYGVFKGDYRFSGCWPEFSSYAVIVDLVAFYGKFVNVSVILYQQCLI